MTTAIIGCGQLVTLRGPNRPRVGGEMSDLGIVENGGLLMRGRKIVAVGASAEIEALIPPDSQVVEAKGQVVTPGLIDAHTHPVFAGNRIEEYERRAQGASYVEIAEAGGGIMSTVRQTRAASEDELFRQSRRYTDWFLKAGTTTVEAKSGYGLTLEDELKILRVIVRLGKETPLNYIPTLLGAHTIPPEYKKRPEAYEKLIVEEMIPLVVRDVLAEWCDVFCESIAFDQDATRRIMTAAKKTGLKLRMHVDQLSREGGAELAAELGAKTADHLEQTGETGIKALRVKGVQPVLLPGSVYALGLDHYPAGRAMIDAGLAVVLASDFNPGSSPTPSLPMAMSLACTHMKMSPAEALTACTINAAYSLDRGTTIGSLEVGKRADVVLWDVEDYREIPYFFGVNHAARVWASGVKTGT